MKNLRYAFYIGTMMIKPLVSIVITTFNRDKLLCRAIDSVLTQDYSNLEIVISDDCSSIDVNALVVQKRKQTVIPIIYRRNESNFGACYTRNEGIKLANGFFITGLDDDDEFTPNRISYLVNNYDPKYAFVTSNTQVITKHNQHSLFSTKVKKVISYKDCLWENAIGTQVLTEKSRFIECDGFDLNLTSAQDADMWMRLIKKFGPALRLNNVSYILHTEHEEDRISTSARKVEGMKAVLEKHKLMMSPAQIKYRKFKISIYKNNQKLKFNSLKFFSLSFVPHLLRKKLGML